MGTTNTTTGSNSSSLQFNPIAQGVYNNLTSGAGSVLGGYINSPFSNPTYNLGASQSQAGAQAAGANNMSALMQNMLTSGIGGQAGAGFKGAQLAQTGRANQAMSSQANIQNVMAALQRQMSAAGTGLSYSPQLTGQSGNFNQSQSMSGLGTWLPQLLSAAGGAALGGLEKMGAGSNITSGINLNNVPSPTSSNIMSMFGGGGMAGMGSGGLASMLQSPGSLQPNPFMSSMFPPQQ